jgi:hypothetical protein
VQDVVASSTFNILVIGFPSTAEGNSTLVNSFTPATVDAQTNASTLVGTVYDPNLCLSGALATYGDLVGAWSKNAIAFFGQGLNFVQGSKTGKLAVWAVNG